MSRIPPKVPYSPPTVPYIPPTIPYVPLQSSEGTKGGSHLLPQVWGVALLVPEHGVWEGEPQRAVGSAGTLERSLHYSLLHLLQFRLRYGFYGRTKLVNFMRVRSFFYCCGIANYIIIYTLFSDVYKFSKKSLSVWFPATLTSNADRFRLERGSSLEQF